MSVSRAPARKYVAELLEDALVGDNKPVDAVYPYQVYDIGSLSKVVFVSSGPSTRRQLGFGGELCRTQILLDLHLLVLYSDIESGWTDEHAEDALDEIEAMIADVVQANMTSEYWSIISYNEEGLGVSDSVAISGKVYKREIVSLRMEVFE
jgi:hypothetical protein